LTGERNVNLPASNGSRRRFLGVAIGSLCAPAAFAQIAARPLRIIVPFPAGGGTDVLARIVADRLRGSYASAVIVENRVGASGRLGVEAVKNAEPNGGTLLFTPDFLLTVYPHSFRKLSYDPVADFAPVALVARSALALCAGPAVPPSVRSARDYVDWAKANPKQAFYATTSAGGTPHFVGVMLARDSGVELSPVHYKGGAPALQDLLGGQVPMSINPVGEILPYARSGKLRVLATTGAQRSRFLPEVPTMAESGYRDIVLAPWLGFLAPARIPAETLSRLAVAIVEATQAPDVAQSFEKFGNEPASGSPASFAATLKADLERWAPIVKASGFTAED
jgi:tripartite-type tricarboxylate transporter receptor subunit TctC